MNKHRPTLTRDQIAWILDQARKEAAVDDEAMGLVSVLAPYLSKIDNAAVKPAYATTRTSQLEALGGVAPIDKEAYWKLCWEKWSRSPQGCSVIEIQNAQEYRYLHELMDVEEVQKFEDMASVDFLDENNASDLYLDKETS